MSILVTGGTGYIGSHTVVELLHEGYEVVIVDNLSNSSIDMVERIKEITNKDITFYQIDLLDKESLEHVFEKHKIEAVIHLAGLKAVGESANIPLKYYRNNIVSTINICEVMEKYKVYQLIFSSSATVYGNPEKLPITEEAPTKAINPYGRTKLMCEEILEDLSKTNTNWRIALLRYFNPVGAHPSGLIGEKPNGNPNNLMPYISKVATGELKCLNVYGGDYPTKDGTGVRDFIHVVDLAKGHLAALKNINVIDGVEPFNLGTGKGYSVLEVVKTYEKVSRTNIPYIIVNRRQGDVAISYADPTKANRILKWAAEMNLTEMCKTDWNWQIKEFESTPI